MFSQALGWLLGLEDVQSIDGWSVSFAAPWMQRPDAPFWVFLGAVALIAAAFVFYLRLQDRGGLPMRIWLAISRSALLLLIFLTLADPVLRVYRTSLLPPRFYVVVDGTESMAIEDDYSTAEEDALQAAIGADGATAESAPELSTRLDYVKALLAQENSPLLTLQQRGFDVQAFVFEGDNTSLLRQLTLSPEGERELNARHVVDQIEATGQVTAIGQILNDLSRQYESQRLGGVLLISDFAQNAGVAPYDSSGAEVSPAERLGAPIHTVGVGAEETKDLAVRLSPPPRMKRGEASSLRVQLKQSGLTGLQARVTVKGRPLGGTTREEPFEVGSREVTLDNVQTEVFNFTPTDAGRFEFFAEVEPLDGEAIEENNRDAREVNVVDDFLRLMYVAYEPNWEWRFVKEVFHRDKMVGMRGFRTFLRSSDPKVRQSNPLFLPALTPKRSDFFANDVIFLGDMPARDLSPRFCDMTKEFVGKFGGGLVIIGGPRFGAGELADTALADLLPVVIDESQTIDDQEEFRPEIAPLAPEFGFMQLSRAEAGEDAENWSEDRAAMQKNWQELLGPLPWYQPVKRLKVEATPLMVHPTAVCDDGKTPQPLMAIKRYGAGEVVYLGFDETWRLRKLHGELYYRQFWSQLIYRLGMSHALGNQKRFVVRMDRPQYRADEEATLIVEAYNENYEPLTSDDLDGGALEAELIPPGADAAAGNARPLRVTALRPGEFETRVRLLESGEYAIRVKDPVTEEYNEVRFQVAGLSAERRGGVRNEDTQRKIALASGGKSLSLAEVASYIESLQPEPTEDVRQRVRPLWSTPLWFLLAIGLMVSEWFLRKRSHLR